MPEISRHIKKDVQPFDAYASDPTGQTVTVSDVPRVPYVITEIIAQWTIDSTQTNLIIGGRNIDLTKHNQDGFLNLQCHMQVGHKDKVKLTTKASAGGNGLFLEIMGYVDYRRIDTK